MFLPNFAPRIKFRGHFPQGSISFRLPGTPVGSNSKQLCNAKGKNKQQRQEAL